jgi:hypothetical protein
MAEELKIGISVDTGQLGKLADASEEVARSARSMGSSFATASEAAANLASKLLAQGVGAGGRNPQHPLSL